MKNGEQISALVLAAGLSRRMGAFKPLLPLRGRTLIENSVDSALSGGADTLVVVTGYRAGEVEQTLSRSFGNRVRFVRNEAYAETDMLRSVQTGLSALPKCDAFFLLPGDMPVISKETFLRLLQARALSPAPVLFPTLNGYRKHPPLIDARLIPTIRGFSGEGGLRELWKNMAGVIRTVPVDDAGIWIDIDTPDDYRQCLEKYDAPTGDTR